MPLRWTGSRAFDSGALGRGPVNSPVDWPYDQDTVIDSIDIHKSLGRCIPRLNEVS